MIVPLPSAPAPLRENFRQEPLIWGGQTETKKRKGLAQRARSSQRRAE